MEGTSGIINFQPLISLELMRLFIANEVHSGGLIHLALMNVPKFLVIGRQRTIAYMFLRARDWVEHKSLVAKHIPDGHKGHNYGYMNYFVLFEPSVKC